MDLGETSNYVRNFLNTIGHDLYVVFTSSNFSGNGAGANQHRDVRPFTSACLTAIFLTIVYGSNRLKKWFKSGGSINLGPLDRPPQNGGMHWWELPLIFLTLMIPISLLLGMAHLARLNIDSPGYIDRTIDEFFAYRVITISACIGIGLVAYYVRCHRRMTYSIIEFAVGVYACLSATNFHDPVGALQFAAGVYIIVRAFDNFEKALSDEKWAGSRISRLWNSIFKST